jgi:hypothetical protein
MNDLDYRTKAIIQLAIFVPIVLECRFSFQKYLDDILERMRVLELLSGGVLGKVYSGLLGVVV